MLRQKKPVEISKQDEIINNEWVISLQNGKKIKSKVLINASGPWINDTLNKNIKIKSKNKIRLVKGSHIITKKLYKEDVAFTFQNTDKRIIFVIEFSLIGTTELEANPQKIMEYQIKKSIFN